MYLSHFIINRNNPEYRKNGFPWKLTLLGKHGGCPKAGSTGNPLPKLMPQF